MEGVRKACRADNDKKYVPTSILDTYPHRAMRYAVLAPLVGSADYIEHDIPKMLALLRQQWTAALLVVAEGREVETAERLVVPWTIAQRHVPEPRAGVHVEGDELRVWRLEER